MNVTHSIRPSVGAPVSPWSVQPPTVTGCCDDRRGGSTYGRDSFIDDLVFDEGVEIPKPDPVSRRINP